MQKERLTFDERRLIGLGEQVLIGRRGFDGAPGEERRRLEGRLQSAVDDVSARLVRLDRTAARLLRAGRRVVVRTRSGIGLLAPEESAAPIGRRVPTRRLIVCHPVSPVVVMIVLLRW